MDDSQKITRVVPPKEFFDSEAKQAVTHEIGKQQLLTPVYRVECPEEGGIFSWLQGDKFPVKGWAFREAVFAVDSVKRVAMNSVKFIAGLPSNLWYRRVIRSAIDLFVDYTDVIFDRWGRVLSFTDDKGIEFGLAGVCLKPNLFCDIGREVWRVGMEMVGSDGILQRFIRAICMILEFDDAWRYRVQDFFGILDKVAFLKNPRKELIRAFKVFIERAPNEADKIRHFAKVIPYLLWIPTIKKTLITFVMKADFDKLRADDKDFYRTLLWTGYKFGGISDEERISLRMMIDAEWQHGININNKHK